MKTKMNQCYNCNGGVIAYTRQREDPVWQCLCKGEEE